MSEPYTGSKPACTRDDALAVLKRLRESGHVAYFAGGCVRDLLLGYEPKDWDVATDAPPNRVRKLFSQTQAVGAAFGVILVRHGRSVVEVATFRADLTYEDGRRPTGVRFTSAEEDARRRDFTINGLFLDPIDNRLIDYVGGQEDLNARRLRAIGDADARFDEDHLRLLRAVRFAARFGLEVEPLTAAAIARHAQQLKRISPERIAEELRLMLTPPTRIGAWNHLWSFGLMPIIFRQLPETATAPPDRPILPHVAPTESIGFALALAATTLDVRLAGRDDDTLLPLLEPPQIRKTVNACRTGLRISNDEADALGQLLDLMGILGVTEPTVATMKRFLARPHSSDARRLLDALVSSRPELHRIPWLREQFAVLDQTDVAPPPLVTGDDLLQAGLRPGPAFKRILDATYDAQLAGQVTTKAQALAAALEIARRAAH